MFCCLEPVSCRLAVATNCRLELQPVVTNIPKCECEQVKFRLKKKVTKCSGGRWDSECEHWGGGGGGGREKAVMLLI